jgi:hypothetical protein
VVRLLLLLRRLAWGLLQPVMRLQGRQQHLLQRQQLQKGLQVLVQGSWMWGQRPQLGPSPLPVQLLLQQCLQHSQVLLLPLLLLLLRGSLQRRRCC